MTEKFDINPLEAFKVLCTYTRNTPTQSKTAQLSRSVEQLTNTVHLALQCGWFMHFGLVGSHNQSYTFYALVNLLVTILFYIHAWHQMIKAARCDRNGVLQNVPWSVGHFLSDVTSASPGSLNKPIRCNQKHQSVFLNILFAGQKRQSFGVLEKSV